MAGILCPRGVLGFVCDISGAKTKMTDANTICHDLDLLGDWLDAKGYTEEAGLCTKAMDEINRLREALKPFADKAELYSEWAGTARDAVWFPISDLRAARAALISDKLEAVNDLHGETLEKLDD